MSQQDVDLAQAWLSTFGDNRDAFQELLHPDIVWFPFEDNHTPSHGIDGALRVRDGWVDTWDALRADVEDVVEGSDGVVVSIHVTAQGKTSGVEVDVRQHLHFKLRDGKVAYVFEHGNRAAALEAVGLRD